MLRGVGGRAWWWLDTEGARDTGWRIPKVSIPLQLSWGSQPPADELLRLRSLSGLSQGELPSWASPEWQATEL